MNIGTVWCPIKRIVRHGGKIQAVRHNAGFVSDITAEHGSFGRFAGAWPDDDIVGLWGFLAKRGKRLGGNTGRYFLRFIGKDSFLPSFDVVFHIARPWLGNRRKPDIQA